MAKPTALELYEKLVATDPRVERKGATVLYTSLNGNMLSYLSKEGKLALRLPPEEREAFLKQYNVRLCQAYGRVPPEYVEVPDSLLSSTRELKKFFDCSYAYAGSLKPKPTTRSKAGRSSAARIVGVLALALWCGAGTPARAAGDEFPVTQGKAYKFEKVAEGVYYASGGVGSNNVVIVNDRDVVLVDDGTTPAAARALLEDIRLLTNKPVSTVVNTHFHYDHTDGNSVFGPEVQIIGHEYLRNAILTFNVLDREPFKTSQKDRLPVQIASLREQLAAAKDAARKTELANQLASAQALSEQLKEIKPTPPNVTYASKMVLYKGGREIQLLFLGRGHTGGDTFVYLPRERIVCTGDMDEGARIAYMGDAFFDEWIATLEALKKLDFTLVLPGHGRPFRDKGQITAFQSYLKDLTAQVADLRKQGVKPEEAAKRVDLSSHKKDFPDIQGAGADLRGVRRIYQWMDESQK